MVAANRHGLYRHIMVAAGRHGLYRHIMVAAGRKAVGHRPKKYTTILF